MMIHHQVCPFPSGFSHLTWSLSEAGPQPSSQFLQEDQETAAGLFPKKNLTLLNFQLKGKYCICQIQAQVMKKYITAFLYIRTER